MWLPAMHSIRRKLDLILLASVGLALLLAAAALLATETRREWAKAQRDLLVQADVIGLASEAALAFGDQKVGEQSLRVLQANPSVIAAALYDERGRLFASFRAPNVEAAVVPDRRPSPGLRSDWSQGTVLRPVTSGGLPVGSIYIQQRHGVVGEILEYVAWLVAITLVSLFVALLLAQRLQRSITQPILEVSAVAQTVLERGTFDVRARKTSEDEVGRLVDAFNAMLDELGTRAKVLEASNEALSASEARYQLAASGSSAGLWDWDLASRTMYHSARLKAALGYSALEFPDEPDALMRIMHPDDQAAVRAALRAHLTQDAQFQAECRLRSRDGSWRWFLITGMSQKDRHGRTRRMAGSLIDITERKNSELLLQQSNRAKDEFLATLAHELRNPLAPLRTGLQILKSPNAPANTARRTLETMDRQLTHMVRLIDDLLDISRINSGKIRIEPGPTTVRAAVQAALDLSRPAMDAAGHAVTVDLPATDIPLLADETRLAQAFGNLLNNAAKYTPPGGQVHVRAWREADMACVEIRDNGIGIPDDMQERVFGLFAQVEAQGDQPKAGGLGIGLFLVRSLVELHGGSVQAHSGGPGQGTTFTVRLPCLARAAASGSEPAPAPDVAARGPALRVLVVDDNRDAAETLATFLQMIGMATHAVHAGEHALPAAREFRPDVVLLDIGLPGMDGYAVARQLRASPGIGEPLLVAVTGWGAEEDRRRSSEAGFDAHLTKPVDVAALEALLQRLQAGQKT